VLCRHTVACWQVFKHHHEETTGRTSSIGQHNLCLDSKGQILNDSQFRNTTCGEYVKQASKVVTLVDLAGQSIRSHCGANS
jgi:GTPase